MIILAIALLAFIVPTVVSAEGPPVLSQDQQAALNGDGAGTGTNVNAAVSIDQQVTNGLGYVNFAASGGDLSGPAVTLDAAVAQQQTQTATNWFAVVMLAIGCCLVVAASYLIVKKNGLKNMVNSAYRHILQFLIGSKVVMAFAKSSLRSARDAPISAAAIFAFIIAIAATVAIIATGPPTIILISVAACIIAVTAIWTLTVVVMKRYDISIFSGLTLGFANGFAGTPGSFVFSGHERSRGHQQQQTNTNAMSGFLPFSRVFGHKTQHRLTTTGQTTELNAISSSRTEIAVDITSSSSSDANSLTGAVVGSFAQKGR